MKSYHLRCEICWFEETVEELDTVIERQEKHTLAQGTDHVVGFEVVG